MFCTCVVLLAGTHQTPRVAAISFGGLWDRPKKLCRIRLLVHRRGKRNSERSPGDSRFSCPLLCFSELSSLIGHHPSPPLANSHLSCGKFPPYSGKPFLTSPGQIPHPWAMGGNSLRKPSRSSQDLLFPQYLLAQALLALLEEACFLSGRQCGDEYLSL